MTTTLPKAKRKLELKKFQQEPSQKIRNFLLDTKDNTGICLQGNTGSGKTFVIAQALKEAQDKGLYLSNPNRPFQHYSVIFLTPRNCVGQQQRVFNLAGCKNVLVTSPDSLRTDFGEIFMDWITKIVNGTEQIIPIWNEDFSPDLIICDESQYFKNLESQRGKVLLAFIKQRLGKLVFISATHFQKACEAKYAILGCGIVSNPSDFEHYAWDISPGGPTANSPTAIKRIKEDLEKRNKWITISNVKYPFKPKIELKFLDMPEKKRPIYDAAYEKFLEERRKHGKNDPSGILAILNAIREFQKAEEMLKADDMAIIAKHVKDNYNNNVIIGSNFVNTLLIAKRTLLEAGVPAHEIGELHGGVPDNKKQAMIDGFQFGNIRYFLTTLKSGGTGLSLHHESPNSFPRTMLMSLPWSIYEFIQFLGRGQRITNLSPVNQYLITYNNTIGSEKIAPRLKEKLNCVRELLDRKDSFIHDIFDKATEGEIIEKLEQDDLKNEDGEVEETSGFDSAMLDGEQ